MIWASLNVATALMASAIIVYLLTAYPDRFHAAERAMMAFVAAGMVLRVGPILGKNVLKVDTPFDDWSTTFLHLGVAGYLLCKLWKIEGWKLKWRM